MAQLIAIADWSVSVLGPVAHWPQSLRTVIDLMLPCAPQMVLFWGPRHIIFYNDAYIPTLRGRHPQALGEPAEKFFGNLWAELSPVLANVRATGETVSWRDRLLHISGAGLKDDVYFDITHSPVRDETGGIAGVLCIFSETTEKVRAALRESHDHLRMAESAGGVGLFLIDIERGKMTVSAEFCRLFGLPAAEVFDCADMELLLAPDGPPSADLSEKTRRAGESCLNVQYRIRRADTGELRWIARRAEFVRDDAGRPKWMRGAVHDITDRKMAEDSLRESESRFRVLAQAIPNQVWTASPDGKLDWINQKVYDYTGQSHEQLLGDGWEQLVHPDDLLLVAAAWQHSIEIGQRYETEFRIRRHDGVYRWHIVRAVPTVTNTGTRWLGTNTDIDDQKSLQQDLAELNLTLKQRVEERTRDLDRMWNLSTDLILVVRPEGEIRAVNPATKDILGWQEHELIGKPFIQMVHPADKLATMVAVNRLVAGVITQCFENRCQHKDGSYRTISWTAAPDAGLIHAVGRDVSAERVAAEALREAQERLRQSQKMEALGQLTGGIAHDFNNLLQGISGSIEVVKKRIAEGRYEDTARFMDAASQSAHRAAALVHRLLAFARRQSLDSKPVNVHGLVLSMDELLQRTLGKSITFHVQPSVGTWTAYSDESQLESAILNLAINARDAMPKGGLLMISTRNETLDSNYTRLHAGLEPGDYVVIAVQDTGIGMSREMLAKVFEPFFTTKPIGQGTGLGLSMIYGFAQQSGGHVRIVSRVGEGTTVSLYLPRHRLDPLALVDKLKQEAQIQAEGETVLVVEDDEAVRLIVLDELNELGYQTLQAIDGPTAIAILHSQRKLDLLLTDVGLPGMNGRQLAEISREHRPNLPILFMTGYAENALSRADFLAPGMQMISKPFAMEALAARIRGMLSKEANSHVAVSHTDILKSEF